MIDLKASKNIKQEGDIGIWFISMDIKVGVSQIFKINFLFCTRRKCRSHNMSDIDYKSRFIGILRLDELIFI